jgi:peptidyl-prolyl cis-trans isomerase SurA
MIRKTGFTTIALLLIVGSAHSQKIKYGDGIIAIVDDEVITVYDVALFVSNREKELRASTADATPEERKQVVQKMNELRKMGAYRLIENRLLYAEFKDSGFTLPTELVDRRIDKMVKRDADGDYGKFEDMLEDQDQNIDDLRKDVSQRLAVQLLINQMIDRKINISPAQIKAYYEANTSDFSKPRAMKLRMIEVHSAGKSSADYQALVKTVSEKLSSGADFNAVAAAHSDHGKKASGDDIVWMKEKDLNSALRAGLPSLDKGATSKAVELGGNTYFLHIEEVQGGDMVPLEDVRQTISDYLYNREKKKRLAKYVDSLREKTYVRVFFKDDE